MAYGSPFTAVLVPGGEISQDLAALSFFVFFLKQVWRLDLQLRSRQARLEQRYYEAREAADAAEAKWRRARDRLSEEDSGLLGGTAGSPPGRTEFEDLDREQGWGVGASEGVAERAESPWVGRKATWSEGEDEVTRP
jgi:hypothetical protein